MAEVLGTSVPGGDDAAKGEMKNPLELAECEGLPRQILEAGCAEHVFERMDFLWRASNCLRLSSPALSRVYSDQLRKMCAHHEVQLPASAGASSRPARPLLPDQVSASLCASCGCILTPGVNCRVRVRHRSLSSPSVRKAATKKMNGKKKCINEVVTTCFMCGGINTRGGAEREARDKKRRRRTRGHGEHVAETLARERGSSNRNKRSRVANLRGNFTSLAKDDARSAATKTTLERKPGHAPPRVSPASKLVGNTLKGGGKGHGSGSSDSSRTGGSRGNGFRRDTSGGGGADGDFAVAALQTPARPTRPAAAEGAGGSQPKGARSSGGSGAGKGGQRGETPTLSLLERIRRDAKKKRRQEAAAAASAAGATK